MITLTLYTPLSQFLYTVLSQSIAACPQVFSSGGTCTLLPSFLGVHPNFTLHLGVQRKLTAFSPRKVVHHAVFVNITQLAKTFFFCLTFGQTESGVLSDPWPLCLSHHFFVILYITCQILFFYTELNARLPIYSHDH
jgi:hypothetical protein